MHVPFLSAIVAFIAITSALPENPPSGEAIPRDAIAAIKRGATLQPRDCCSHKCKDYKDTTLHCPKKYARWCGGGLGLIKCCENKQKGCDEPGYGGDQGPWSYPLGDWDNYWESMVGPDRDD